MLNDFTPTDWITTAEAAAKEVVMSSETVKQYQLKIKEQFGVGSDYMGLGDTEDSVLESLVRDPPVTWHVFRLVEHPEDYPGYVKCCIEEDAQGTPTLWYLVPLDLDKSVVTLPYGLAAPP